MALRYGPIAAVVTGLLFTLVMAQASMDRVSGVGSGLMLSIARDGRGDIWAAVAGEDHEDLLRFSGDDGTFELTGSWSALDDPRFSTSTPLSWGALAPAQAGGVWLGGETARRFDGVGFVDPIPSPAGWVWILAEGSDGAVWAIAGEPDARSLWSWDGSTWTETRLTGSPAYTPYGLALDGYGRVWVDGWDENDDGSVLDRWSGTSWRRFDWQDLRSSGMGIADVAATPTGDLLVSIESKKRPMRFDGATWKPLNDVPKTRGTWTFEAAPSGDLVLLSRAGAFVMQADGSIEAFDAPAGDYAGRPWVALDEGIVFARSNGRRAGLYLGRGDTETRIWALTDRPAAPPERELPGIQS